jgi:transposase
MPRKKILLPEQRRPRVHIAQSPATLADGKVYHYAYLRYEVWDPKKQRHQPKPLAALGRVDRLEPGRLKSLGGFLQEWLRKDSSLPFEALEERFRVAEPVFEILLSRDFGLRWVLEQAWAELGYKEVVAELGEHLRDGSKVELAIFAMVLVQLVAPQSKRGIAEWKGIELFFPEGEELVLGDLYRAMDVLEAGYEAVEHKLSEQLRKLGIQTEQLSEDTTTVGMSIRYDDLERAAIEQRRQERGEAQRRATINDPPLRLRGKSKNKRDDLPQVVLEAVVGDHGLVVHHQTHPGNASDKTMIAPTLEVLGELGYKDVRFAADTGFNSTAARNALREAQFEFVLGEGVERTGTVKQVLAHPGRYAQHPTRPELSYKAVLRAANEERVDGKPGRDRLYIIRHNSDEEARELHRIDGKVAHIEEVLRRGTEKQKAGLLKGNSLRRFVKRDGRKKDARGRAIGAPMLDRAAVERARRNAGKSVIATDSVELLSWEVDAIYRKLFDVEAAFSQLKSTLRVGPVHHRKASRIRAHMMIAVMALNLGRWLQRKSGSSLESLQRLFRNLRVQHVKMGEALYWERVELEPAQEAMLQRLGYDLPPKRFTVTVMD